MGAYSNTSIGNIQKPIGLIEIDWNKNDLPYQFLSKIFFQQKHFRKKREKTEDGEFLTHYFYMRPISEILTCLELIGSTIEQIRDLYIQELNSYKKELSLYNAKPDDDDDDEFYSSYYEEYNTKKIEYLLDYIIKECCVLASRGGRYTGLI